MDDAFRMNQDIMRSISISTAIGLNFKFLVIMEAINRDFLAIPVRVFEGVAGVPCKLSRGKGPEGTAPTP